MRHSSVSDRAARRSWASRGLTLLLGMLLPALLAAASPVPAVGSEGMVSSRSVLASEVGAEIMRGGGNAIDAAVATGFALAVTYPSAGNLGGGGFLVMRLADGSVVTNDHREAAPAAAHRDMFLDADGEVQTDLSLHSHLAAGVPGTVDGLLAALERQGTLSRREVLAPAIRLARDGFPLPVDIARDFERQRERFAAHPGSRRAFLKEDGTPYAPGELFRQPALAVTLERIARLGRDGFYGGETADLIVQEMRRGGGLITHEDLAAYRSVWREPIAGEYRGYEIYSMPPPSSGGVLLVQMLNMLEPFDIGAMGYGSAAAIHVMIEAARRAYADRAEHLGDPDFYPVPVEQLTSKVYARQRFADFSPERASRSSEIGAGQWPAEGMETTHVSVMDAAGNAVAYTTTLNLAYGSKIAVDGAGFLLNNEMDDFSAKPGVPNVYELIGGEANAIEPGKRMLSSMTPTIVVKDDVPVLVTGSPGGSTIIMTTFQVVVNVIDHGMSVADAVARPRFHHQGLPDRVLYEAYGISPDTLELLRQKGHRELVRMPPGRGFGDANSVMRQGDRLYGIEDPRTLGGAVGF
jgi:gamma-glutamyltranspeptidase / glutathione hydrolase